MRPGESRFARWQRLETLLLDVRTPAEFEEVHIDGSVLMPLGDLNTEEVKRHRGTKSMSLERQVRIAAGALVFIGAALGYFVNSSWIALPDFVGAGLVFAGITNTCGMGMLIALMPWNNRRH